MATSSLSAGEALASTSGKDNYQRLARLIIVGGTTLLRDVFDSIYPPSALPYCLTNPAISSKLSWINKRERQCLYPSPGKCGRSVDFDITMLFKLLKTICNLPTPTGKWVDLPDDSDTSLSADIARIRCYRNCICHDSENMEIRNDQFLSLWANIRDAMIRIAQWLSKGSEWKSAVDKFLKDPLTLDSERHVEELTQWYINDMEHKKALKELKDETSHIKDDTSQIKGDTSQIKGETSHIKDDTSHIKDDTSHIKDDTSQIKGDTSQISQINVNTVEIKQMLYAVMMNMRVDCESMTYRTSQPNTDESQGPTSSPVSSATTSTCEKKVVLKLIEEAYMRTHDPSDPDEINKFQEFMAELNVIITGTSRGSLVITLRIDSLQILENLWNVYCSGYLGKMVQSCLATDYVLNKLNLRELKLKTTILKEDYEACKRQFTQSSAVETVHSPSKAYSSVNSRSSWRALLDPFQKLLERLSQEIEEEQLESLKLLLENHIPAGTLEECKTARNLFKCMKQKGLLGYNNLDFLEELLTEAKRLDLLEIVKEFKLQPAMEIDSGYPATEKVCFSFASQRQNFIVPDTVDALINSMNLVLRVDPRECLFIKCEEVASNWFNLMFELPNRREVVDKLCLNALEKEPWLTQCGVKAVKIGDKSEIHVQAPITGFLPKSIARGDLQSSAQDVSLGVPCKRDDQKLDLIVVVDCATVNSAILGQLKTQLKYMVDYVSRNSAHFRLAIISYQNHPCSGRRVPTASVSNIASVVNFTDDKAKMKEGINSLRCFGISGSRSGLADGLALAVHLSNNNDDDDDDDTYYKCRREAHTVCVLLPLEVQFGTLDIFKCTHGHDVLNLCRQLAGNAVALYVVMRRTSKLVIPPYLPSSGRHIDLMEEFFTGISLMTGGQFIHIKSVKLVSEVTNSALEKIGQTTGVYIPFSFRKVVCIPLRPTKTRKVKVLRDGTYSISSSSEKTRNCQNYHILVSIRKSAKRGHCTRAEQECCIMTD